MWNTGDSSPSGSFFNQGGHLTRETLEWFRAEYRSYLKHGEKAISDMMKFKDAKREIVCFVDALDRAEERVVMRAMYLQGKNVLSASFLCQRSERQTERIRKRVLEELDRKNEIINRRRQKT